MLWLWLQLYAVDETYDFGWDGTFTFRPKSLMQREDETFQPFHSQTKEIILLSHFPEYYQNILFAKTRKVFHTKIMKYYCGNTVFDQARPTGIWDFW